MARRPHYEERGRLWPKMLLLVIICLLVGGFFAYFPGVQRLSGRYLAPLLSSQSREQAATPAPRVTGKVALADTPSTTAETRTPAPATINPKLQKDNTALRGEVDRLAKVVEEKERAITERDDRILDLTIQLKMAASGKKKTAK